MRQIFVQYLTNTNSPTAEKFIFNFFSYIQRSEWQLPKTRAVYLYALSLKLDMSQKTWSELDLGLAVWFGLTHLE